MKIWFALIAERDTRFFLSVARILSTCGYSINFVCFLEAEAEKVEADGYQAITISRLEEKYSQEHRRGHVDNFDSFCLSAAIIHEGRWYRDSTNAIKRKFVKYHSLFSTWLSDEKVDFVFQELGGFVAPLSLMSACLANQVNHIFIEPTLIRGRFVLMKNSLSHKFIGAEYVTPEAQKEGRAVLAEYRKDRQSMYSKKDLINLHRVTFTRIFDNENLSKFFRKLSRRYIQRSLDQYDRMFLYGWRALKAVVLYKWHRNIYASRVANTSKPIIYFPLHAPIDYSTNIRWDSQRNQFDLLEEIVITFSSDYQVVTKEHPSTIGFYDYGRLKYLRRKGLQVIDPMVENFDLLPAVDVVIGINSKAIFEAGVDGKLAFDCGISCFQDSLVTINFESLDSIDVFLKSPQRISDHRSQLEQNLAVFFSRLVESSVRGELYVNDIENVTMFANSIDVAVRQNKFVAAQ